MKIRILLSTCLLALAACEPSVTDNSGNAQQLPETEGVADVTSTSETSCADDGERFEVSGVCKGRAINYIDYPASDQELDFFNTMTGEACRWELMETRFAMDALLYQGVVCGDNRASLEFAGGARSAHLYLASSPFGPDMGDFENPVAWVISSDPADPTANILVWTREGMDDPEAAARCVVRKIEGEEGMPGDAYVVDVTDDVIATLDQDMPRAECGPFGFNGDELSYWRILGDQAFFFSLGQEPNGLSASSLTLLPPKSE